MAIGLGTMREELEGTSVDALFLRGEAENVLKRENAKEDLEKIVKSERGDNRLRVIAQELLIQDGNKPFPKMVRVYCEAVPGAFMHQWWGLPGHHLGKFGERIVELGEAALPHLIKELDDSDLLTSLGPDAPIAREKQYSVGDLAAYIMCNILDRPYPDAETPEERTRLRNQLRDDVEEMLANERRK